MIMALDSDFGVVFDDFGGKTGGKVADEEENSVTCDNEDSNDEKFVGGEKGKIEEIAEEWDEKGEGDDGKNGEEK